MFNLLNRLKFQWLFFIFLFMSLSNSHGKKTDEKVWKIVYKKDLPQGVICTINSDGTGKKRLTPKDKWSETPIPTPDGQHIEYVSEDPDSQVLVHYLMDIDGKNRRLLTDNDYLSGNSLQDFPSEGDVAFSPNGELFAYVIDFHNMYKRMFVTPLTGSGETIEVTEFLLGYFGNLAFSPDGKEIFFDRADNWTSDDWAIFVVSLDENPPKPRKLEISIDRPYFAPHPLPNGKGLIFLASSDLLFGDVYKLDYMSNTIKGLSGKYGETNATALKVSQDGGIVAYDAQIGEDSDIFVAYLNADSLVRLTSDPEDEWLLDLSPDGEFILFDRENSKKGKTYADLFIMKTDGTSERRLTNKEIWASARFIPDSKLKIEK